MQKIAILAREHMPLSDQSNDGLALLKLLPYFPSEQWEEFASTHKLEDWLCLPLQGELSETVSRFLSMYKQLAFQSEQDALTEVGNLRFFNKHLEAEVARARRAHTDLALIYIDLDDFKQVNDTYGHSCGDVVLRRLAKTLKSLVRHYDIVARLGGEEFVVLLPSSSRWTGVMLANRLLTAFRQETFDFGKGVFSMTFSGGISSLAQLEGEQTGEALVQSADKAMYHAKHTGKNTIVLAESAKSTRDKASLVQAQEKQFLFSGGSEQHI